MYTLGGERERWRGRGGGREERWRGVMERRDRESMFIALVHMVLSSLKYKMLSQCFQRSGI